jgi:hypothetical protein
MRLGKKLKTLLVLLILTSFSSQVLAQPPDLPGQFKQLVEGEPVPFDGWCFDDTATGALLSTIDVLEGRCILELDRHIAEQKALFNLEIGKLSLRYDTLKRQNTDILMLKDQEIKDLEAAALKRPNDYVVWWALGGFILGTATASFLIYSVK